MRSGFGPLEAYEGPDGSRTIGFPTGGPSSTAMNPGSTDAFFVLSRSAISVSLLFLEKSFMILSLCGAIFGASALFLC